MIEIQELENKLADCLSQRKDVLRLPIKQRAKFEGWLKIELATALANDARFKNVRLEETFQRSKKADLSFSAVGKRFFVQMKTCNTNWRMEEVEERTRPITMNIASVIQDIRSLKELSHADLGLVVMVLFPVHRKMTDASPRDKKLDLFLQRIEEAAGYERGSLRGKFVPVVGQAGILTYVIRPEP